MDEYIKREAAIEAIMSEPPDAHYPQWYAEKIKSIPAADVAPVRHGRWVTTYDIVHICSVCGEWCGCGGCTNYCPNCGAKMDGCDGNGAICSKTT